jgi:transposase
VHAKLGDLNDRLEQLVTDAVDREPAGRELVELALRTIATIDRELAALDRAPRGFARRQPDCRALIANLYGVGAISATAILAELGDCRRCQRRSVAGVTQNDRQAARGDTRVNGASKTRSLGRSCGRATWRSSTRNW